MKRCILALLIFSLSRIQAAPFADGDRWSVIGDSITQNGTYFAWIYLYYATRFPDRRLRVENLGISGDSAGGGLRRYKWDIQPRKGTAATVMFGMNDVSRELYGQASPDQALLMQREAALASYRRNLKELTNQLRSDGLRVVLITPSPYDDTAALNTPPATGVNDALAQCADFMAKLASESGATVIDLHTPLSEINKRLQREDPKSTIIGPDRIHPGSAGHFAMAYFFLKGQDAPGTVSEIEIDATTGGVRSENAKIEKIKGGPTGIEFESLEGALPYPVPAEAAAALKWVPFHEELNRQIIRVKGLQGKSFTMFIDDLNIGEFTAGELSKGVNLGALRNTPQARQAAEVLELVKKWQKMSAQKDRGIAQVEHFFLRELPHPVSLEEARPRLEAVLSGLREKEDEYKIGIIRRYLDVKANEENTRDELELLADKIHSASQPRPHACRISVATPAN